jgi:hypothetical protein
MHFFLFCVLFLLLLLSFFFFFFFFGLSSWQWRVTIEVGQKSSNTNAYTYIFAPGGASQTHSPVTRLAYITSLDLGSIIWTHSSLRKRIQRNRRSLRTSCRLLKKKKKKKNANEQTVTCTFHHSCLQCRQRFKTNIQVRMINTWIRQQWTWNCRMIYWQIEVFQSGVNVYDETDRT